VGGDDSQPSHTAGQWLERALTLAELRAALEKASARLLDVPEVARAAFARAIEDYHAELHRKIADGADWAQNAMRGFDCKHIDIANLMRCCERGDMPGAELRLHRRLSINTTAIHVRDVGTLELRHWPLHDTMSATYVPYRSTAMLPSYRDNCPRVALPWGVWCKAVSAQALGEARDGIGSVQTCTHGGREYTIVGVMYGKQVEAEAWAIVPRQIWAGPTYTSHQLRVAYDGGNIERGDHRGQLVKVRGQMCVLQAMSLFFDTSAAWLRD
jgi:hypothetical protein